MHRYHQNTLMLVPILIPNHCFILPKPCLCIWACERQGSSAHCKIYLYVKTFKIIYFVFFDIKICTQCVPVFQGTQIIEEE